MKKAANTHKYKTTDTAPAKQTYCGLEAIENSGLKTLENK